LLDQLARDWSARTGASVAVWPSTGDADIQVMTAAELPSWVVRGQLREVPDDIRSSSHSFRWSELPGAYSEKLLRWDGRVYALPVVGEGHVLVWRTDLFANRGRTTPPRTWDEFLAIADSFWKESGQMPVLAPLPQTPDVLDRLFYTIAAAYDRPVLTEGSRAREAARMTAAEEDAYFSFHYSLATGQPRIGRPAFIYALELLQRMKKLQPAEGGDPIEAFRSGKAVMMIAPLEALARCQQTDSPVRNLFAIAPIPGADFTFDYQTGEKVHGGGTVNRMPYVGWGGLVAGVTKGSENPKAAWDFLAEIGDPVKTSLELIGAAKWGAGPTRLPHLETRNRNAWFGYGLSSAQTDNLIEQLRLNLAPGIANYRVRLRIPGEEQRLEILDKALRDAIATGANPQNALQKVADAWTQLDKSRPQEQSRDLYRKSLGL
jgi:multiple sugar transport system substrate-binding protein